MKNRTGLQFNDCDELARLPTGTLAHMLALIDRLAAMAAGEHAGEPVFCARCHPDGSLTDEVLSAKNIEPVRVRSDA